MDATSKFYVAKGKDVTITPPTVYNRTNEKKFEGWENVVLAEGLLKGKFTDDTQIPAKGMAVPEMEIQLPNSGDRYVYVVKMADGVTGKLEMSINGASSTLESQTIVTRARKGRRMVTQTTVLFTLPQAVHTGDVIHYWAEKDGLRSKVKEYTVK